MKLLNKVLILLLSVIYVFQSNKSFSQSSDKADLNITINYYVNNNTLPYLLVAVKSKVNGKFQPVNNITLKLFLDKDSIGTFINKVTTNNQGIAMSDIPSTVKKEWATTSKHTFLARFDGNSAYASAKADITVARAKLLIDTSERSITASVLEMKDTAWVPVKGVDVILAVRRLGGDLLINETPTFTTDSTGKASGDFKRDSIPGDAKGNIIIVAKVVDNDTYGNLVIEKTVPWGNKFVYVSTFNKRTLFATRDKAPIWLLFIVYSIVIAVWGILIYLVFNIFKIKKLGQSI
ncbi:hypothetical protein [Mucilaginibacter sp.]